MTRGTRYMTDMEGHGRGSESAGLYPKPATVRLCIGLESDIPSTGFLPDEIR